MKLTETKVFRLSVISSILLFVSTMFSANIASASLLIYVFLCVFIFFGVMLCWSAIFWLSKKTKRSYIPFLINFLFFLVMIELPLNWITLKTKFKFHKNDYEEAAKLISESKLDSVATTYQLPNKYRYLSANDGKVYIQRNTQCKFIVFYTVKGDFEGKNGFVKLLDDKSNLECVINEFGSTKNLGDNWYYISTE